VKGPDSPLSTHAMTHIDAGSLYGTVNVLILKTLTPGPEHGLGIARRVERASKDALRIEEGALYPALHRLERDGLLRSTWGVSDSNRRAKFYDLTDKGRQSLDREVEAWVARARAICDVLEVSWQRTT